MNNKKKKGMNVMKKLNLKKKMMVLSKRKIAAVICTALLATAGVINYVGTNNDTTPVNLNLPEGNESYESDTNYGEAQYVSNKEDTNEKEQTTENEKTDENEDIKNLTIEKSRSEAVSLLQTIAQSDDANVDRKAEAQSEIIRIARDIEKEAVVTELLKAKGFSDVSVYMNSPGATVSVKSEGLSDSDLAKIRDTMKTDGNIMPQNLKIIETK